MRISPKQYLPADIALVKSAKEFKRFSFFGFRFGPSKVKELALATVESRHGPVLQAQVRIGNKWQPVSQAILDTITVRHINLAVHTAKLSARPPAPALARNNAMSYRPRAASAPLAGAPLQRANAMRRHATAPPAYPAVSSTDFAAVHVHSAKLRRADSVQSQAADQGVWEDFSASHNSSPLFSRTSSSASMTTIDLNEIEANSPVGQYLSYMAHPRAYGTHTEVMALSQLLQRPINVVMLNATGENTASGTRPFTVVHSYDTEAGSPFPQQNKPIYLLLDATKQVGVNGNYNHYQPLDPAAIKGAWTPKSLRAAAGISKADGSCLFDSVSQSIGNLGDAATLRALTVTALSDAVGQNDPISKGLVVAMATETINGLSVAEYAKASLALDLG